jgi:hypothetical protein
MPGNGFNTRVLRMHAEFLVGKPEGRRPLGRPRPRWKADMKIEGVDWIPLAHIVV